jgi:hypothetical protein
VTRLVRLPFDLLEAASRRVFAPSVTLLADSGVVWCGNWRSAVGCCSNQSASTPTRIDRGSLVVSAASMKKFMGERGFLGPLHETSAKTGKGCDQLREAIVQAIDWKSIPETTSSALYHRLKQEILSLRDSGLVLIRLAELKRGWR